MVDLLPHRFHADGYYDSPMGPLFTGPAPFDFDKNVPDRFYTAPWVIVHPQACQDCLYRVKAVESFALQWIQKGQSIGLLVEAIEPSHS